VSGSRGSRIRKKSQKRPARTYTRDRRRRPRRMTTRGNDFLRADASKRARGPRCTDGMPLIIIQRFARQELDQAKASTKSIVPTKGIALATSSPPRRSGDAVARARIQGGPRPGARRAAAVVRSRYGKSQMSEGVKARKGRKKTEERRESERREGER
jgi:hypothetical protein